MLSIALDKPFRLSFGEVLTLPRVIYTVELSDGTVGYGEASIDFPFSNYDMFDVYHALRKLDIQGADIKDRERLFREQSSPNGLMMFPAAFTAFSMAIDDAYGKAFQSPIADLYGGSHRTGGKAMLSISLGGTDEELLKEVNRAVAGMYLPKVKTGMTPESDERVIRRMDATGVDYALDFNAAYPYETAYDLIVRLLGSGGLRHALYLEQPTRKEDGVEALSGIAQLLRDSGSKCEVVADESFLDVNDALACARGGVSLNFKMQKIGGIYQARKIEAELTESGFTVRSMVGGTFPTAIGRVYDQISACALRSACLYSDGLLPSTDYFIGEKHLIVEDFQRSEGMSIPISGPGLGVHVDEKKLEKFVVPAPEAEYALIREGKSGDRISIVLRNDASYKQLYEERSGRSARWNV